MGSLMVLRHGGRWWIG